MYAYNVLPVPLATRLYTQSGQTCGFVNNMSSMANATVLDVSCTKIANMNRVPQTEETDVEREVHRCVPSTDMSGARVLGVTKVRFSAKKFIKLEFSLLVLAVVVVWALVSLPVAFHFLPNQVIKYQYYIYNHNYSISISCDNIIMKHNCTDCYNNNIVFSKFHFVLIIIKSYV